MSDNPKLVIISFGLVKFYFHQSNAVHFRILIVIITRTIESENLIYLS